MITTVIMIMESGFSVALNYALYDVFIIHQLFGMVTMEWNSYGSTKMEFLIDQ